MLFLKVFFAAAFLMFVPEQSLAADTELKPGDVIGPHNWQRVQSMVGQNLLNRIKGGYTFKIKPSRPRREPKEYIAATEKYAGRVGLGNRGELVNYVAGRPFPNISPSDPKAGLKLAWNFVNRWLGDDRKDGGGTASERATMYILEKNGSERKNEVIRYTIRTRGRVSMAPLPAFEGYDHINWMSLYADEYPRDTSGTTTLEIRYADPDHEDDLYVYVPIIRLVRHAPPTQRCATFGRQQFNFDDVNSFNGKVTNFNYKFIGQRQMIGNFSQQQIPLRRKQGDYLPLDEAWEVFDAFVLEITPKDSRYCYPRKVLHIDTATYQNIWGQIFDAKGNLWKEQLSFYVPVELVDGQEGLSFVTAIIVDVPNGRSTVLNTSRVFNQGYRPSLFTLQTLQTVMRGGALR